MQSGSQVVRHHGTGLCSLSPENQGQHEQSKQFPILKQKQTNKRWNIFWAQMQDKINIINPEIKYKFKY